MVNKVKPDVTALRLRYLKAVEEICREGSLGFATPAEVEARIGLRPKLAKVLLKRLFDMGWLERPYRGCYRLADKGKKILKEAEG